MKTRKDSEVRCGQGRPLCRREKRAEYDASSSCNSVDLNAPVTVILHCHGLPCCTANAFDLKIIDGRPRPPGTAVGRQKSCQTPSRSAGISCSTLRFPPACGGTCRVTGRGRARGSRRPSRGGRCAALAANEWVESRRNRGSTGPEHRVPTICGDKSVRVRAEGAHSRLTTGVALRCRRCLSWLYLDRIRSCGASDQRPPPGRIVGYQSVSLWPFLHEKSRASAPGRRCRFRPGTL